MVFVLLLKDKFLVSFSFASFPFHSKGDFIERSVSSNTTFSWVVFALFRLLVLFLWREFRRNDEKNGSFMSATEMWTEIEQWGTEIVLIYWTCNGLFRGIPMHSKFLFDEREGESKRESECMLELYVSSLRNWFGWGFRRDPSVSFRSEVSNSRSIRMESTSPINHVMLDSLRLVVNDGVANRRTTQTFVSEQLFSDCLNQSHEFYISHLLSPSSSSPPQPHPRITIVLPAIVYCWFYSLFISQINRM